MILITNDDGIFARGIVSLARAMAELDEVLVVAPDRERSTVGHAITVRRPLSLWPIEVGPYPEGVRAFACDGTPADCVILALGGAIEDVGDVSLVLSGINCGANLGDEITYSGTVAAAIEASLFGVPSVALSLAVGDEGLFNFAGAAERAVELIETIREIKMPPKTFLNVNFPDLPSPSIRGFLVTKKGTKLYKGKITPLCDPKGRRYYWIGGTAEEHLEEGSDVWAVANGYVSVTPINLDMTDYAFMKPLGEMLAR